MSIGMGAALGLWLISGVASWSGFVALGFRFRRTDEREEASVPDGVAPTPRHATRRAAADHVLARSVR